LRTLRLCASALKLRNAYAVTSALVDAVFEEGEHVLKFGAVGFVGGHEVFVGGEHHAGAGDLVEIGGGQGLRGVAGREGGGVVAGVDLEDAVQAEIADEFEVAGADADEHEAAGRVLLEQIEGGAGQHAEEGAVHAAAVLKIDHEAGLPLIDQRVEKIVEAAAVLKGGAALDAHDHGIGIGINEVGGFGGLGHGGKESGAGGPPRTGSGLNQ